MNQGDFWNDKFSNYDYMYGLKPNHFIAMKSKILKTPSDILCVAEGEGRNAIFLAKQNHNVEVIDASSVGIDKLVLRAKKENLNIKTKCLNLEYWNDDEDYDSKYDAIVSSYMHLVEPLKSNVFNKIYNKLNKNGYFIGEFFSKNQINYNSGGPQNIELLYDAKYFKTIFKDNHIKYLQEEIVMLDEGIGHQGEASVVRIVICKD